MTEMTLRVGGVKVSNFDFSLTRFYGDGGRNMFVKTHPLPAKALSDMWFFYDRNGEFDINWNPQAVSRVDYQHCSVRRFVAQNVGEKFEFLIHFDCKECKA